MIVFSKKTAAVEQTSKKADVTGEVKPSGERPEDNRFEQIRRTAAAGRRKSVEDKRLL
jgi:hypothetical protein